MKTYYLVTTAHLEERLWFRDKEDFTVGMNYVALQASCSNVSVLSFILMSNHVHFVLYGDAGDVQLFINQFKGRYSQYYGRKWGVKGFLRYNPVDFKEIPSSPESLERSIAYVLMNCVAANICLHPSQYLWGTGNCFFQMTVPRGEMTGNLSKRALGRLLHSNNVEIPSRWLLSEVGYILPESYVNIKAVEAIFRTPMRMDYFLRTSSKAKKRLEVAEDQLPAFRDQLILQALPDLCQSLFHKSNFQALDHGEQVELLRQLRYRFSSNVNQLARVCGLTYAGAARLLDNV